jgi:hypothetical protein
MIPSRWPRWTLIIIGLVLALLPIVVVLLLEPVSQAFAPTIIPTPTLPFIHYARPLSGECEKCHFDKQALAASTKSSENAEDFYIEPASVDTPHGQLGCIACHGGTANVADKEAAHQSLIKDLSETHPEDCLLCHRNLPDQIPEDHLRTPHGRVVNAAWEGSTCGVLCSDCHGQVGHGFDPVTGEIICPMSVCLDCHRERGLGAKLTDCNTCHVGPHDVALSLSCKDCHTSTETWKETTLLVHPVEIMGRHATVDCFSCHSWPNFKGLDYVCSDCHERSHEFGNDDCALCHTPIGWAESAEALVAGVTAIPHPVAGREDCRSCHGMEGQPPIPTDHKGRTNDTCQICHAAAPAPAILHPVEGREPCLSCHDEGQIAQFPLPTHRGRDEASCRICHEPAGVTPLPILHSVEGRADCLMCHAPQAFQPYPESHEGWGNQLCQLCHQAEALPTEAEHPFPQDHDGAAENCALCHPNGDFAAYHCETCHAPGGMQEVHGARGISEIESKCVLCHPQGQKP